MEKVVVALIVGFCIGLFLAPLTHLEKKTGRHVIQSVSSCNLPEEILKHPCFICRDGSLVSAGFSCSTN